MASFVQAPAPVLTASVTSGTITYGSNVTAGNLLVLFLRMNSPQTVTDNLGDGVAWARTGAYFGNNSPADKAMWWKIAGATGPCTLTCGAFSSGTFRAVCAEYSGGVLVPQQTTIKEERAATVTTTTNGPLQANPGDLVFSALGGPTASETLTAGTVAPNSHLTQGGTAGYIGFEDEPNWPGGPVTSTFTLSVASTPDGMIAVFGPSPFKQPLLPRGMPLGG